MYRLAILKDRLFLYGFLDHNILESGDKIDEEHPLPSGLSTNLTWLMNTGEFYREFFD